MESVAPSIGHLTPAFAHATVGDAMPWGAVNDTDLLRHAGRIDELTAVGIVSTLDVARVPAWGRA